MDFLIHYRIASPRTAEVFRASLKTMNVCFYPGEGSVLVTTDPAGKQGLIAQLQQDLRLEKWSPDDFVNLYFSESGQTLNCWQMKRVGRTRLIRMAKQHPYFRY